MWYNKHKAITFSFDDGVTQDKTLIKILNDYGLKATFNLNSELLGQKYVLQCGENCVNHNKVKVEEVKDIYKNHEVSVHTLTHPNLTTLNDNEVIRQVSQDKINLEKIVGYPIVGMAYPCGGINNNDRVAKLIEKCDIKYSRTITSTYNFETQSNLLRFNPTIHFIDAQNLDNLVNEFLSIETEEDKIFYIWGHSYELDLPQNSWQRFEQLCKKLSNRKDVFYGTNKEVLLNNL